MVISRFISTGNSNVPSSSVVIASARGLAGAGLLNDEDRVHHRMRVGDRPRCTVDEYRRRDRTRCCRLAVDPAACEGVIDSVVPSDRTGGSLKQRPAKGCAIVSCTG